MPRFPRIHYPGAAYHVMARGVDGRDVFLDDADRRAFMHAALRVKAETPYSLLAYCLMGNHFHFAIRVGHIPLSKVMHRLLTAYVMAFNGRHSRTGHLFQARYKSVLCLDERYLLSLIRYIHMNPVRAGLVAAPGEWAWSSHRQYVDFSHSSFVDTRAMEKLLRSESGGISLIPEAGFDPWPVREEKTAAALIRDEPPEMRAIDAIATELFSDPEILAEIKSGCRRRLLTDKKRQLVRAALKNGHTISAIARWLSCGKSAVDYLLRKNN